MLLQFTDCIFRRLLALAVLNIDSRDWGLGVVFISNSGAVQLLVELVTGKRK